MLPNSSWLWRYKDINKFQDEVLNLPLAGVEAILASDDLRVASEDAVYDFVLIWARIQYPKKRGSFWNSGDPPYKIYPPPLHYMQKAQKGQGTLFKRQCPSQATDIHQGWEL